MISCAHAMFSPCPPDILGPGRQGLQTSASPFSTIVPGTALDLWTYTDIHEINLNKEYERRQGKLLLAGKALPFQFTGEMS